LLNARRAGLGKGWVRVERDWPAKAKVLEMLVDFQRCGDAGAVRSGLPHGSRSRAGRVWQDGEEATGAIR